ncbi:MAG: hypothetical protein MUC63_10405 [Planctomycetes bacterium]|nr:hypothetical protein [Planctomycetota bacterium]
MANAADNILTPEGLQGRSAYCPETVFMMGAYLECLDESIRKVDRDKHLCLGSILASTPPVWVFKDSYYIGRWMVTNGDYLQFMQSTMEAEGGGDPVHVYDDPSLWNFVWSGGNLRLTDLKMPMKRGELVETMIENYQGANSFVEAYLLSLQYELERLLLGEEEGAAELRGLIETVILYAKRRLWDMLGGGEGDAGDEGDALSPEQAVASIDQLVGEIYKRYAELVDPRFKQALRARNFPVENLLFFTRLKAAVQKVDPQYYIPISMVLYPRFWKKPPGAKQEGGFIGNQVPWAQQPVYGITLYEALAYTAWLSQQTDPYRKSIFPWHAPGGKEFHDYNSFFGQEGRSMETFYFFNRREFQTLLEETAKRAPDGQDVYQLLGFGWQWTCDRYDPVEHKYNRFHPDTYPTCRSLAGRFEPEGPTIPIYQYKPNSNMSHSYFVVRGSPDVVGGPGTTTRRFSVYPMRGYRNVGFRFVFRQN